MTRFLSICNGNEIRGDSMRNKFSLCEESEVKILIIHDSCVYGHCSLYTHRWRPSAFQCLLNDWNWIMLLLNVLSEIRRILTLCTCIFIVRFFSSFSHTHPLSFSLNFFGWFVSTNDSTWCISNTRCLIRSSIIRVICVIHQYTHSIFIYDFFSLAFDLKKIGAKKKFVTAHKISYTFKNNVEWNGFRFCVFFFLLFLFYSFIW